MSDSDYVAVFTGVAAAKNAGPDALKLGWNEDAWRKILAHTQPRRFRAGDVVIQRGAGDRALCFIAAGTLEVGVDGAAGAGASIARVGAGSVIGEQSFFDGQPRSMNVWAVSDGELLRLAPEAFDAFAQAEPALARNLLFALGRILSVRLRQSTKAF